MQLVRKWKNAYFSDSVWKLEWFVAAAVMVLMLCTYTYVDLKSLTVWSTNFWDVLYEGRLSEFYSYCAANIHSAPHWQISGDYIGLLAWSVWNLPIWAVQRFLHIEIVDNSILLLWSKLFLAAAFALLMWFTYKIAMLLVRDNTKALFCVFLCVSSLYVFTGIGYAGQNDVLFLLAATAGVYALVKEKPQPWLFYVCTAFSIAIKPFFFFPYVAVLLLMDRNLFRVLLRIFYGVSGMLLCRVLCYGMPYYRESLAGGAMDAVLNNLFRFGFGTSLGVASTFVIALFVLYLWCYFIKPDSREKMIQWVVYAVAAGFMITVLCTSFEFYRPLILVPFIPLVMITNADKLNLNVLLDTAMSLCLTVLLFFNGSSVYDPQWMEQAVLPLPQVDAARRVLPTLSELLEDIGYIRPAFAAAVIVCGAALLVLNHPSGFIRAKCNGERCERWILWLRLAMPAGLYLLSFVCYFWVR